MGNESKVIMGNQNKNPNSGNNSGAKPSQTEQTRKADQRPDEKRSDEKQPNRSNPSVNAPSSAPDRESNKSQKPQTGSAYHS